MGFWGSVVGSLTVVAALNRPLSFVPRALTLTGDVSQMSAGCFFLKPHWCSRPASWMKADTRRGALLHVCNHPRRSPCTTARVLSRLPCPRSASGPLPRAAETWTSTRCPGLRHCTGQRSGPLGTAAATAGPQLRASAGAVLSV